MPGKVKRGRMGGDPCAPCANAKRAKLCSASIRSSAYRTVDIRVAGASDTCKPEKHARVGSLCGSGRSQFAPDYSGTGTSVKPLRLINAGT